MTEESRWSRLTESTSNMLLTPEIRERTFRQVRHGALHFGAPPLLVEAVSVISDRLTGLTIPVTGVFNGYGPSLFTFTRGDYTQMPAPYKADTFYTYPPEIGEPAVHLGFRDGKIQDVVLQKRSKRDESGYQETTVIFFGLNGRQTIEGENKKISVVDYFYFKNSNESLSFPPIGVYVNFSSYDSSGRMRGRATDTLRSVIGETKWPINVEYGDSEVFPWAYYSGEVPYERGAVSVDNSILLPIDETLKLDFYSRVLRECARSNSSEDDE
jgi:hypothetical protein